MSSKAAERAAEKAIKDAAKAAEREAKEVARAAKDAEKAEKKEVRQAHRAEVQARTLEIKERVARSKLSGDETIEDFVEILASVDDPPLLKQSVIGKFSLDHNLYKLNSSVIHSQLGGIIDNGGRSISSILRLIADDNASEFVPFLAKLVANIREFNGITNLQLLLNVATVNPNSVYQYVNDIVKNSLECLDKSCASCLYPIIRRAGMATSPIDAANQMFLEMIKLMKNYQDDTSMSLALYEISNLKEKVTKSILDANISFLLQYRHTNAITCATIEDYAAGRSLKTVTARVDVHEERINAHESWLKSQETRLNSLADKFNLSQEKMMEMTEKMNAIATNDQELSQMLSLVEDINSLMSDKRANEKQHADLEALFSSDPYYRSFHNALRSELTATFIAAKSVQTDIVSNSRTGVAGNVGNILQTASAYVPVIGAGVLFFGAVLNLVDANIQSAMVQRYANLAVDTEDMNKLTRTLANEMIKWVDREKVNKPASILETCQKLLVGGIALFSGGLGGADTSGGIGSGLLSVAANAATSEAQAASASAISAVSSYDFGRFFSRKKAAVLTAEEQEQQQAQRRVAEAKAQGESDAGIVANAIISFVYSGAVSSRDVLEDRIACLLAFARVEFGSSDYVADSASSSSSWTGTSAAGKDSKSSAVDNNKQDCDCEEDLGNNDTAGARAAVAAQVQMQVEMVPPKGKSSDPCACIIC